MRKIPLAAGAALGLFALPLVAMAQDATPPAPDAGAPAAVAPASGDADTATPAPKKAHHDAREHGPAGKHHAKKAKAAETAPAPMDAAPAANPR